MGSNGSGETWPFYEQNLRDNSLEAIMYSMVLHSNLPQLLC